MRARIILLVLFIGVMFALTSLDNFRESFDTDRAMNRKLLDTIAQEKAQKAKEEAEKERKAKEMAESGKKVVKLDTPELKRGHEVYHGEGACFTCHGENAEGNKDLNAPLLAGQHDWYLYAQLVDMKNKKRINEDMMPFLEPLTEEDFKAVSEYISKLRLEQ